MTSSAALCYIEKAPVFATYQEQLLAARTLAGATFKLYIYLNGFTETKFIYERIEAEKILNLDRTTLNRAFEELRTKNYLIGKMGKNFYFCTFPVENTKEHGQGDNIYTESMKKQQ